MSYRTPDGQRPYVEPLTRGEDQEQLNRKHQRSALAGVLEIVQRQQTGAVDLVTLVGLLGLEEQLDELAGSARRHPERHRRLEAARAEAQLTVDEAVDQVE
jgi:hypothetical protein